MTTKPYFYYLFLPVLILISTMPGLGVLEFFRHTEADRALIAEEMLQTGDYIVPHLLGQPILTKPPVYYWLSAAVFKISGKTSEFEARLPSVLAAIILALAHFAASFYAGFSLRYSFASSLVLISSVAFFTLSALAEIDMLYAALTAASLYLLYFAISRASLVLTLFSYIFAGLAFLTKGPPVVAFYAIACLGFYFIAGKQYRLRNFFIFNIFGVLVFISILSFWFIPLFEQIDFSILKYQFNREILGRAIGQPRKDRSSLFYVGTALGSGLPWTLPFFIALYFERIAWKEKLVQNKSFLQFCALVFCAGFLVLSLAKGKSGRYLFPLHTFAMQCLFFGLVQTKDFWTRQRVSIIIRNSCYFLILILFIATAVIAYQKFGASIFFLVIPFLSFLGAVGFFIEKKQLQFAFLALVACLLSARLIQTRIYYPHRNSSRTVKPIVASIHKIIGNEPVYTAEMYERWIAYYLKKEAVQSIQLLGLKSIIPDREQIFWLITDKDESDLLELLKSDASSVLLSEYALSNTNMFLYQTNTQKALQILNHLKLTREERKTY